MEFVVTFDIADQSFKTYSMSEWKKHIYELKTEMQEEEDEPYYMSDEEVIEQQYGDELFWEKVSLVKTHGYWHLEEE